MEILAIIIYLISPIPLGIWVICLYTKNQKLKNELFELQKELTKKINQPDTLTGVPVDSAFRQKEDGNMTPLAGNAPVAPPAPLPYSEAGPKSPVPANRPAPLSNPGAQPVSPVSANRPAPLPPSGVKPVPPVPVSKPAPLPNSVSPLPYREQKLPASAGLQHVAANNKVQPGKAQSEKETTVPVMAIGVILLLLAAVGFISATWSNLSAGARAVALLSFSFILLGAGIFARLKLQLENASLAFYSIGSIALPITICGSAYFRLLGKAFSFDTYNSICNTFILAASCLLVLLVFGALFFESRVFAAGALGAATLLIISVSLRLTDVFPADVIITVLFAVATVLLIPYISKKEADSRLYPFAEVYEIYAVINVYVMTCFCLAAYEWNPTLGAFLLVMGAVFFHPSVLNRANGLLSLPGIILLLLGTGFLFKPNRLLSAILWMETVAACLIALAYVLKKESVIRKISFVLGVLFLAAVSFPLFHYALIDFTRHPAPLLLTLPIIGGFLFLTKNRKNPLYANGAVLPVFTLLAGLSLHAVSQFAPSYDETSYYRIFPNMDSAWAMGTVFAVAGVLYLLYHAIPHHPLFTSSGSLILLILFTVFSFQYLNEFHGVWEDFAARNVFGFGFVLLCLFMAVRKDLFSVRDRSLKEQPMSFTLLRCFHAVCFPLYYAAAYFTCSPRTPASAMGLSLTAFLLICFVTVVLFLLKTDLTAITGISVNEKQKAPVLLLAGTSVFSLLIAMSFFCFAGYYVKKSTPLLYVIRHLIPFMIPALLLLAFFRLKKKDRKSSFTLLLCGLFMATACLFYAVEIFREFGSAEATGIPGFCFSAEFLLSLAVIPVLLYYVLRSEREELTGRAGFFWATGVTLLLFIIRLCNTSLQQNVVFSVAVGLALLLIALLFQRKIPAVGLLFCGIFAVHYLQTVHVLCHLNGVPAFAEVLICQIPVLLFGFTKFRYFMILFQSLAFLATPILTWAQSEKEADALRNVGFIPEKYNVIGRLTGTLFAFFTESHFLAFALPGFFIAAAFWYFYERDEQTGKRILALLLVALSTLLCMRFPGSLSAADHFGQLYLIPAILFVVFLPWILPEKMVYEHKSGIENAQFISAVVVMVLLGITSLGDDTLRNLLCYAVVSFLALLLAYILKSRNYLMLGGICMLALILYLINRIWGDMSWWIYLFLTGTTLITIAVRNEIRKRK